MSESPPPRRSGDHPPPDHVVLDGSARFDLLGPARRACGAGPVASGGDGRKRRADGRGWPEDDARRLLAWALEDAAADPVSGLVDVVAQARWLAGVRTGEGIPPAQFAAHLEVLAAVLAEEAPPPVGARAAARLGEAAAAVRADPPGAGPA